MYLNRSLFAFSAVVFFLVIGLFGCKRKGYIEEGMDAGEAPQVPTPAVDPVLGDIPFDKSLPADPARSPQRPAVTPVQISLRYILIKHIGAQGASGIKWNQAEANRRADRIVQVARQKGSDFLELAHKYSDVPSAERGVSIGLTRGQMDSAFEEAAFGMRPGEVSNTVHTPLGYYIIERIEEEQYSTAHILVQYKGALNTPVGIKRTKEEARKRAEMVHKQALSTEVNFGVLAERFSDSPSRIRGGILRPMSPNQMPPAYQNYLAAVRHLKEGEISSVVETPFGFHVIKRLKLEKISARHILISYNGSEGTPRESRTKQAAEELASKVLQEVNAKGADFAALAQKYSDCPSAAKGGDLGLFARGMMVPRFEQIAFSLGVGQISDLVETKFGFHIIQRTK
jgi:parvulin-like peptidyl-prolyl isomerase